MIYPEFVIQCENKWKFYYKDKLIDIFETEEEAKEFQKEFSNDPEKYYNELTGKSTPHLTVGWVVENRTKDKPPTSYSFYYKNKTIAKFKTEEEAKE